MSEATRRSVLDHVRSNMTARHYTSALIDELGTGLIKASFAPL